MRVTRGFTCECSLPLFPLPPAVTHTLSYVVPRLIPIFLFIGAAGYPATASDISTVTSLFLSKTDFSRALAKQVYITNVGIYIVFPVTNSLLIGDTIIILSEQQQMIQTSTSLN